LTPQVYRYISIAVVYRSQELIFSEGMGAMKTVVLSTKVDRERERPLVRAAAETAGMSVAAFVRMVVLDAARKQLTDQLSAAEQ
jgi:uncharacterized protein YbjT (DUF2867 family)